MISFENFTPKEGMPIYLQIILHVKRGIVSREIKDGDEMPSRRVLSALLGVNPNTVQKAYKQLEDEGLITSSQGAKSCVSVKEKTASLLSKELLRSDARGAVEALKQMGLSLSEVLTLIERLWGEV